MPKGKGKGKGKGGKAPQNAALGACKTGWASKSSAGKKQPDGTVSLKDKWQDRFFVLACGSEPCLSWYKSDKVSLAFPSVRTMPTHPLAAFVLIFRIVRLLVFWVHDQSLAQRQLPDMHAHTGFPCKERGQGVTAVAGRTRG